MPGDGPVLVSWCAKNNDPYERGRDGKYQLKDGKPQAGPTLTLMFDPESPYANTIEDVVLLYNEPLQVKENGASLVVRQTIEGPVPAAWLPLAGRSRGLPESTQPARARRKGHARSRCS